MILKLPAELQRKIMTNLPARYLKMTHHTCKELKSLELTRLLTGWYLECLTSLDQYISYNRRIEYNRMDKRKGSIYCMYEMIEHLNRMVGDYTVWDMYDTLLHDFKYVLTRRIFENPERGVFDPAINKTLEKKILRLGNIKRFRYIREILKSKTLRALIL